MENSLKDHSSLRWRGGGGEKRGKDRRGGAAVCREDERNFKRCFCLQWRLRLAKVLSSLRDDDVVDAFAKIVCHANKHEACLYIRHVKYVSNGIILAEHEDSRGRGKTSNLVSLIPFRCLDQEVTMTKGVVVSRFHIEFISFSIHLTREHV